MASMSFCCFQSRALADKTGLLPWLPFLESCLLTPAQCCVLGLDADWFLCMAWTVPKDPHIPWSCPLPSTLLHISEPAVGLIPPAPVPLPSSIVSKKPCSTDLKIWHEIVCQHSDAQLEQREAHRKRVIEITFIHHCQLTSPAKPDKGKQA